MHGLFILILIFLKAARNAIPHGTQTSTCITVNYIILALTCKLFEIQTFIMTKIMSDVEKTTSDII